MASTNDIPLPAGFQAAGLHCGIKKDPAVFDLGLFVSDRPATSAGVFTTNLVHGAPVKVSRERVGRTSSRAVVINSGNANACTGDRGIEDARWMTGLAASQIGCAAEDVLVCSTGVIGRFLPREKLEIGIPAAAKQLAAHPAAFLNAARGIMTTDTFPKQATRSGEIGGKTIRISGAAKGAAMIAPNMATMLCVIMTDAALTADGADTLLRHAVDRSFNCISVEGHMSTSDTVLLLANGAAGNGPLSPPDRARFQQMLDEVAADLAQGIIRDAEGADHEITIDVRGLRTRDEAYRIAKEVAESPLVKTAITGGDPNWGRIVSAVGYAGVKLQETDITLRLNNVLLYQSGAPVAFNAAEVSAALKGNRQVHIELDLPLGSESVRFWTCDLTAEYVRLNADYTT
jgi:glutamate N-acetyltransferase / amino-acid N-acetyltransferase